MYSSTEVFAVETLDEGGRATLQLIGELDFAGAPILRQAVLDLLNARQRVVTLDLGGLDFVDVAGLRAMAEAKQTITAMNVGFEMRAAGAFVLRVMELVRMDELMSAIKLDRDVAQDSGRGDQVTP